MNELTAVNGTITISDGERTTYTMQLADPALLSYPVVPTLPGRTRHIVVTVTIGSLDWTPRERGLCPATRPRLGRIVRARKGRR